MTEEEKKREEMVVGRLEKELKRMQDSGEFVGNQFMYDLEYVRNLLQYGKDRSPVLALRSVEYLTKNSKEKYHIANYFLITNFMANEEPRQPKFSIFVYGVNGSWEYELVGIMANSGFSHWVAYIKDQYEQHPQWYYCNDLGPSVTALQSNPRDERLNLRKFEQGSLWTRSYQPALLLYKRNECIGRTDVDDVARALASIASGRE